jgi:hypothetical protein
MEPAKAGGLGPAGVYAMATGCRHNARDAGGWGLAGPAQVKAPSRPQGDGGLGDD